MFLGLKPPENLVFTNLSFLEMHFTVDADYDDGMVPALTLELRPS